MWIKLLYLDLENSKLKEAYCIINKKQIVIMVEISEFDTTNWTHGRLYTFTILGGTKITSFGKVNINITWNIKSGSNLWNGRDYIQGYYMMKFLRYSRARSTSKTTYKPGFSKVCLLETCITFDWNIYFG